MPERKDRTMRSSTVPKLMLRRAVILADMTAPPYAISSWTEVTQASSASDDRIAEWEAFSRLSARERRILALRFYDGRTQTEVAREIGISQAQVSRLEKGAIGRIKKEMSA